LSRLLGRIAIFCPAAVCALFTVTLTTATRAQYVYNPANADEGPGIRYFGSVKDDRGALLPGVSIMISNDQATFLLTTDEQGRFRANLPLDMRPEVVTPKCFKVGYQLVQMSKRLGPTGPKVTVQVDCIMHAARPG
jgi:hypothetical protein